MTKPRTLHVSPMAGQNRKGWLTPMARSLRGFGRDTQGTPAIEFAFVAPILVLVILAAVEITNALQAARRGTAAANVIADLVSRETAVPPDGATIAPYVTDLSGAADALMTPFSGDFTFHVAHVYHDSQGQYDISHPASWQYGSHEAGGTLATAQCDGAGMNYTDLSTDDAVHELAPEFRQVTDVSDSDNPQVIRNNIAPQAGTIVVVRFRYCYTPLLFGVIGNAVVGTQGYVATLAPRNTRCITSDSAEPAATDCTDLGVGGAGS